LKTQKVEMCWCGRPIHYNDERIQHQVQEIVDKFGEFINVKIDGGKTYRVQRHYIALHGITGKDLPALGFQEVKQ
jgi:hypothetical protein